MKFKIKLATIDDAILFSKKCSSFKEDIDVVIGKTVLDAKSLSSVINIIGNKDVFTQIHTDDESTKKKFEENMDIWKEEE